MLKAEPYRENMDMIDMSTRKKRLERLVELAQVYRNWTRRELASALGRDPTKLVPASGNPKLDLIVELADVLDWTVGDVTESLWGRRDESLESDADTEFATLDHQAAEAHRRGDYREMIRMASRSRCIASTPEERALACNRELGGWDGMGRFTRSLELARDGLRESPMDPEIRRMLQSNLANAQYSLWNLTEARASATELVEHYLESPPSTQRDRRTCAFVNYVLGNTHRRMIDAEPRSANKHAAAARTLLLRAAGQFGDAAQFEGDHLAGIARTCLGGILEADVVLGRIDAREATATIVDAMQEIIGNDDPPSGDVLESYGWWCIFGCNIAMRHISDPREVHRLLALFTNKADEVADLLDNWAIRERVFSLQFNGHQRFVGWTGHESPMTIDSDDVRMITGTMGRFPQFRRTGWNMLDSANVVTDAVTTPTTKERIS